jgi:hypothetical protein
MTILHNTLLPKPQIVPHPQKTSICLRVKTFTGYDCIPMPIPAKMANYRMYSERSLTLKRVEVPFLSVSAVFE